MKLWVLTLASALAAFGQNPHRPVPAVGRITDTTFAGNLAASVQGTLPFRPVRFPPVLLLGSGYGYPGYVDPSMYVPPTPPPPPAVVVIQSQPPYPDAPQIATAPEPYSVTDKTQDNTVRIYSNPVTMAPPDAPTKPLTGNQVVVLALKDGGAETAIAYWTDGDQLKYITPDRKQRQIALGKIDTALSTQLNRERGVAFSLGKVD